MKILVREECWRIEPPLRISRGVMDQLPLIVVEIEDERCNRGRGEAVGVPYEGETPQTMMAQIADVSVEIERGISRDDLQNRLGPGGARNALDCALWDLQAKASATPLWRLAG
ncbi:MAG TPA: dipeptide epimerase, partial [Verrucomicrobiae bacterium]|nr:dipeptide epimerase [Verrucomicrobiae bacterium]